MTAAAPEPVTSLASRRRPQPWNPARGVFLATATVTYDPQMLAMGRAAHARIEAGTGTTLDHETLSEAFAELVSHLTVITP